ncbi:MAG: ferredoxin family protein [Bacteroidaceae bacterium]|nr:ferredoxin family protein [Bacteroidaceae bacterium]
MIFYFSATGNTLWAAMQLSEGTQDSMVDMAEAVRQQRYDYVLAPDERIGLCFPVHGWQLPRLVTQFLQRLHIDTSVSHYTYALVTAGDNIGLTMPLLRKLLEQKGMALQSTFSLVMPESYVGLPFMDVDPTEKEQAKIAASNSSLQAWLPRIAAREEGISEEVRGRWPWLNTKVIGRFFHRYLISDRKFRVSPDKCLHCGQCVQACPTHNMQQQDNGLPQWLHTDGCLTCFACYHHCLTHAIEFGRQTKKKGQYYFGKNTRH